MEYLYVIIVEPGKFVDLIKYGVLCRTHVSKIPSPLQKVVLAIQLSSYIISLFNRLKATLHFYQAIPTPSLSNFERKKTLQFLFNILAINYLLLQRHFPITKVIALKKKIAVLKITLSCIEGEYKHYFTLKVGSSFGY